MANSITTETRTTKAAARRLIGPEVLRTYAAKPAPAVEDRVYDRELPAFYLRHLPSGSLTYAVSLGRNRSMSLGSVDLWIDEPSTTDEKGRTKKGRTGAELARAHAAELRRKADAGEALPARRKGSATPEAKTGSGKTLGEVFGKGGLVALPEGRSDVKRFLFAYLVATLGAKTPIDAITGAQVKTALEARYAKQRKAPALKTKIRYAADLKTFWRVAVDAGHATINPMDAVDYKAEKRAAKTQEKREDKAGTFSHLDPAQEKELRKALAMRDARRFKYPPRRQGLPRRVSGPYFDALTPLVLLALNTGARLGGLLKLRWRDVVDVPATLRLRGENQKAGQTYAVPLNREAVAILTTWRPEDAKPNDLIFPARDGGIVRQIWYQFNEVRIDAGLGKDSLPKAFRFHDTRHTFASKLVQRKVALFDVSKLLGHADMRMTVRYAHLNPEHLRGAVDALLVEAPSANQEGAAGAA